MDVSARLAPLAPWTGLVAAGLGWFAHQQGISDALHFDCKAAAGGSAIAWGLGALAFVVAGAVVSWRALPAGDVPAHEGAPRRFIVHLSLMAAGLAALGIGFQMLAAALLPGCPPS